MTGGAVSTIDGDCCHACHQVVLRLDDDYLVALHDRLIVAVEKDRQRLIRLLRLRLIIRIVRLIIGVVI